MVDYNRLADVLARRGYGDDQVTDVMYRNWVRFFSHHLDG
ncbi:MAG: membrane dipeptidase [Pseudomonadales bacterium]|nr:membrane dipeptidase [Pseudomonadales bacterium]